METPPICCTACGTTEDLYAYPVNGGPFINWYCGADKPDDFDQRCAEADARQANAAEAFMTCRCGQRFQLHLDILGRPQRICPSCT